MGDFRDDLMNSVHRAFVATQAFVTLGRVRQVSVTVSGEVNFPGVRIATGLSTAADALLISGGVKKTGSLRNIRIIRAGRAIAFDLYDLLTQQGRMPSMNFVDGDRIVVPPLGPTVAVTGWVRGPRNL